MTTRFITRNSLTQLIPNLLTAFHIVAPVSGENISFFKRISSYEEIEWLDCHTAKPLKEFFLPPSDDIFQFQQQGKKILLAEPMNNHAPRIILGARPCDAAALTVLDRVFSEKGIDVLYTALRDNTLMIGRSCRKPGRDCFCLSVGISPNESRNMDIMLTDVGEDQFLVNLVSPKGKDFFSYFSSFFQEREGLSGYEPAQIKEMAVYLKKERIFDVRVIKEWLDTHFEYPFWADVAAKCIGCGACTFLCPTCHCFDFTDESIAHRDSGYQGLRRRIWDSCSFGHFTQTSISGAGAGGELASGSGHQRRTTQDRRFRQRIMHKFKYFVDLFQQVACVGCGRCRSVCPVGIDLVEVLETIHDLFYQS